MLIFLGVAFDNFHSVMTPSSQGGVTEHKNGRGVHSEIQDTIISRQAVLLSEPFSVAHAFLITADF